MRLGTFKSAMAVTLALVLTALASAAPLDKAALVGQWDYTSYTIVHDGKPGESVQMQPGTLVFTYLANNTWQMQAADPGHTALNGTFQIHDAELILLRSDGSPYQDFTIELRDHGRQMIMTDKRSIVTATKLDATP